MHRVYSFFCVQRSLLVGLRDILGAGVEPWWNMCNTCSLSTILFLCLLFLFSYLTLISTISYISMFSHCCKQQTFIFYYQLNNIPLHKMYTGLQKCISKIFQKLTYSFLWWLQQFVFTPNKLYLSKKKSYVCPNY